MTDKEADSIPTYSLKIINPSNAGGEIIIDKVDLREKFASLETTKRRLLELYPKHTEGYEILFGYITPGHGMKGKQETISTDEELVSMYDLHKKRKRILLWLKCKSKSVKRSLVCGPNDAPPGKRSNSQVGLLNMMSGVDSILDKLKEKHGQKYTSVQLNCWAHMIHANKHESLDTPPNKSFFGKKKSNETVTISPGKRISLRSECINQLDKWHQLVERGVISAEEYKQLQEKILTDIKAF